MRKRIGLCLAAGLMLGLSTVLPGCATDSNATDLQASAAASASEATAEESVSTIAEESASAAAGESASATAEESASATAEASQGSSESADQVLAPKPLSTKGIEQNPYFADSEANIHNDSFNSDVSDAVMSLGIYPEVNSALEQENVTAPSAVFFDEYGHAITPMLGGIAIRDLDSVVVTTLGSYIPSQLGEDFVVQPSYSFVDSENRIVCPTSNNHVIMLQSLDAEGNVLPEFQKIVDIDIIGTAEKVLGKQLDQNLLSITYDFDGNLWFATGGFRIYPERQQTGLMGYVSRDAIEGLLDGQAVDLESQIHFYELEPGEGAENGIAAARAGTIILTNQACYLLRAMDGVDVIWRVPYDSVGAKTSPAGSEITGQGLAWGGGSSPSLTDALVCFTDNMDPVNLIAIELETGEVVAKVPVLEDMPDDLPVSVENSIIVYGGEDDTTSVIICNWFGAGSPGLAAEDSDSSVQTFGNVYDPNWIAEGNVMLAPGMERVDIVKTANGYEAKEVWTRYDMRDTAIFKLSTATGYLYGYIQNLDSDMWEYIALDFDTGETVLTVDVSDQPGYNNMAIGMFDAPGGNALYSPTGFLELLRLQDRFVYLPDSPYRRVDLDKTARERLSADALSSDGAEAVTPVSYLHTAEVDHVHPDTTLAFRMTGLSGSPEDLVLYAENTDGTLVPVEEHQWSLEGAGDTLEEDQIYEVFFNVEDGGAYDLAPDEQNIKASVVLAK